MNNDFVLLFIAGSRDARRIACIVDLQLDATEKSLYAESNCALKDF
jgi:hypothetical protein